MSADIDPQLQMTGETDPRFGEWSTESSELDALASELIEGATGLRAEVAELDDYIHSSEVIDNDTLDQQRVEDTLEQLVGATKLPQFKAASAMFKQLDKPVQSTRHGSNFVSTLLQKRIIDVALDASEQRARHEIRHDKLVTQTKKLKEYWLTEFNTIDSSVSPDILEETVEAVIYPIRQAFIALPPSDSDEYRGALKKKIDFMEAIDPLTDLSSLKFVVATEIVRRFYNEDIVAAIKKIGSLGSYNWVDDDFALYGACNMLSDFHDGSEDGVDPVTIYLALLQRKHTSSRLFSRESRSFKKNIAELHSLASTYRKVAVAETAIAEQPARSKKLRKLYDLSNSIEVSETSMKLVRLLNGNLGKLVDWTNASLDQCQDTDQRAGTLSEAMFYDDFRISVGKQLIDEIEGLGIEIVSGVQEELEAVIQPFISKQLESRDEELKLKTVKEEIDQRKEAMAGLDSKYTLSNTELRRRSPELIELAKILSESLTDHDPLSVESSRALVALMLGIYDRHNGHQPDLSEIIQGYLTDAESLRNLSLELDFLGKPQRSKLLETINLLDELIDSGTFDNPRRNRQLEVFDEFLLEYLDAVASTDGENNEPIIEPEPQPSPLPTPPLPVETIASAEYDDVKVFPPGTNEKEIIDDFVESVSEKELPTIEWERVSRLIQLRDKFTEQKLEVEFIRTRHASWQVLPFFVLEVRLPGNTNSVIVVESPVYGNATYVYREATNRPAWRDVVQVERRLAREFGAVPMVHVDGSRLDNHFVKVWNRVISELTIRQ